MDSLDVLRKAEQLGGKDRKDAILEVLRAARRHGCDYNTGGGKVGGFNVRYGSLKYALMDVNTEGVLYLHIKPHPGKPITDEQRDEANAYIAALDGVTIKNGPIHHYGQVDGTIEDIPQESIEKFFKFSVDNILNRYYNN